MNGFTSGVAIFLDAQDQSKTVSTTIPAGTPLAILTFEINANAPNGIVDLVNVDRMFGDPPVDHVFVTGDETVAPALESGSINVGGEPQPPDNGNGNEGPTVVEVELEVKVRGLEPASVFSVSLSNEAGDTEDLGEITTNSRGRGELEISSEDGDLPLGATGAADLVGLTVTVLDGEGNVVLDRKSVV